MKHCLAPLLVLVLLAGAGAANARFIAQCTDDCAAALTRAEDHAQAGEHESAHEALECAAQLWEDHQLLLRITVGHDALDDITLRLAALRQCSLEEPEAVDSFCADTAELRCQLRLLREAESLNLQNIL